MQKANHKDTKTQRLCVFVSLWFAFVPVRAFAQTVDDFFNDTILNEIHLDVFPADWANLKLDYLENTYFPSDMRWRFDGKDIEIPQIGIRSRGSGSRSPIKPGLRVDFDRYDTKQSFLGLKSFILRNNTQDASMMREFISMGLMRRLGLPGLREAFTKLYVNDEYMGVYTIVESVDKTFLKTHFGEDGGYLYKYDYVAGDPYLFEYRGSDPALYVPKPFKPETHEDSPNGALIAAMVRTMNQASDAAFETAMTSYLDLESSLAEVAAEQFLAEQDGILGDYGLNNFYFYQFATSKRFQFIPWDKSNTFDSLDRSVWLHAGQVVLTRRALAVPSLLASFVDGLVKAMTAAGGPGGWMEQEIARAYGLIRDAAYQDPNKLCDPAHTGGLHPCSNEEFEAAIAFMTQFARTRAATVVAQITAATGMIPNGQQSFTISDRAGSSFLTRGDNNVAVAGYARIQPNPGSTTPAGMAIFSFRQNNTLVTEAAVPAASRIQAGRIYAEVNGPVNTGLAIANPNAQDATISFYFTDSDGHDFGQGTTTIPANSQIARFLNETPYNGGASITGSFTFTSSVPVAVVALRGFTNERSEFLITTQPVTELSNVSPKASVMPHFADGGGWTTQVVLVNPFDQPITGNLQFFGQGTAASAAQPATVTIDGRTSSSFAYTIAARSSVRWRTSGLGAAIQAGSARLASAGALPEAFAIFSFKKDGITVSEAGVPTISAGSAFRMYVEAREPGGLQSGLAVVNVSNTPATVNFELTTLDGASTGLTGVIAVPAGGQSAVFLNQIQGFESLATPFQGVLRVTTPSSAGISMIGLRGRYNERGDFLITTTAPVLENTAATSAELLFPHFVDGAGYVTQFILFSGYAGQTSSGVIQYFSQGGQPLALRIQ